SKWKKRSPARGKNHHRTLSAAAWYPKYVDAEMLRGNTIPLKVVMERLERGERLTPETCGWHYVEGLTLKDDPRIGRLVARGMRVLPRSPEIAPPVVKTLRVATTPPAKCRCQPWDR